MAVSLLAAPLIAALATFLSGAAWRRILTAPRWIDAPRPGRFHQRPTSLAGGPAWLTGLLLGSFFAWVTGSSERAPDPIALDPHSWAGSEHALLLLLIPAASLLAYLLGDADDRGRIAPLPKALLQATLVIVPWYLFVAATQGSGGFTAASVLGLGLALSLQIALGIFDNMDGTLGAVTVIGLVLLGASAPFHSSWIAAGATAGFLIWNRPPARLFLGNRGSSAVSTATACLVACYSSSLSFPGTFLPMLAFVWPIADLGFVTIRRLRGGRRPWQGGKDHTTHEAARLLRSDRYVWLLVGMSAAFGGLVSHLLLSSQG